MCLNYNDKLLYFNILEFTTYCRSTDKHMMEGYLLYVNLRNEHNHRLVCADAYSKRDVSTVTIGRLTELFERGHSPSSALDTLKYDLQEEEGERYFLAAADRSIVPDIQFCYRSENVAIKHVQVTVFSTVIATLGEVTV